MESADKKRLGSLAIAILLFTGIVADIFTLIPFVGIAVGPIFWIFVSIWLWKSGFGFLNARRIATSAISAVAEVIPVVQEFPLIVVGVIVLIFMLKAEERLGLSLSVGKTGMGGKTPLNSGGVRAPINNKIETSSQPLNMAGKRLPNGGIRGV